ncbi:MAG: HD-GYP domain-containing protein [Betaproteobacteria bacterium]|nr:MAG: HD-GYP domain-containing protein [Betaproteobacteria bacterium]
MKKSVPVAELKMGMYVAELDRPWTETPFVFQGFYLETDEQLETLKQYCKTVFVDPDPPKLAEPIALKPLATPRPGARSGASQLDLSRIGKVRYVEQAPVEREVKQAEVAYKSTTKLASEAVEAVRAGRTLDAARVEQAVSSMTESVLRNPDALLLFSQLKQKGDYTTSHAVDVAVYMTAFARFLQLPPEDISLLGYLGLLQDVGKTKLPTELLNKRNRLSEAEFAQAKQHVQYSVEILSETPGLPPGLAGLALLHHERQDGSGYPKGLKGRDVGLLGSIAGIVDTFDALTARRPYAEPVPPSAALSMLYKWRGSFFDPVLIEQFIRCIGIFPLGSTVELNSGEIGIVIAQNLEKRLQPRVMVIRDAAGNPLKPQKLLDLSRGLKAPDGEPYRIRRTLEYGRIPVTAESLFND